MKKNIFIIPSWYPTDKDKLSGIFFKEQSEALSKLQNEYNIIVSTWGFTDGVVKFRSLSSVLKKTFWYLSAKKNVIIKNNNLFCVFNPHLSFSKKIPILGSIERLIDVNRKNIRTSEKYFGKINLIHAHVSYPGGYIAYKLAKSLNIPYIITEHMGPFPFKEYLTGNRPIKEIDVAIRNANQVIAVSPSLSNVIMSYGYLKPIVIPNMVNENQFNIKTKISSSNKFIFLTLCSMAGNEKGIDDLLNAIELWMPDENSIQFIIAGDGEFLPFYKNLAIKKNIDKYIIWSGYINRTDAPILFNSCNAFVLPSKQETFGVVYAEAIACGLPIIATKCGGPESIINKQNGILVNIGDSIEIKNALINIYSNYHNYSKEKIRQNFLENFSQKNVVEKLLDIYNKILINN